MVTVTVDEEAAGAGAAGAGCSSSELEPGPEPEPEAEGAAIFSLYVIFRIFWQIGGVNLAFFGISMCLFRIFGRAGPIIIHIIP